MKLHANHRTCPSSRRLLCSRVAEEGWTLRHAADAAGRSVRTAAKWLARYRSGDRELLDRSSRPRRSPRQLPQQRVEAIERLRRLRMTAVEIAEVLELPLSTVSLWLKRIDSASGRGWIRWSRRTGASAAIPASSYTSTSTDSAASRRSGPGTACSGHGQANTPAASTAA